MTEFRNPETGEPCKPGPYIATLLIKRRPEYKGKILPAKFWNVDPYRKKWKLEIIKVSGLLKIYDPKHIVKALNSKRGEKIYSATCPWLNDLIEEQEVNEKPEPEVASVLETIEIKTEVTKSYGKQSTLAKLRDLDG